MTIEEGSRGAHLRPIDERGQFERQVVRHRRQRRQGGEFGLEPLGGDLVDAFGVEQVFEAVLTQVPIVDPGGVGGERPGGLGHDDLAAVRRGGDAGGAVDVEPDVVVAPEHSLTGMDPHPDQHPATLRPRFGGKAALGDDGGGHRRRSRGERGEERVAFGPDDDSAGTFDGLGHDGVVDGEDIATRPTEALQEPGGPLDVGEQERDRSGGERAHGTRPLMRSGRHHIGGRRSSSPSGGARDGVGLLPARVKSPERRLTSGCSRERSQRRHTFPAPLPRPGERSPRPG